MKKLLVLAASVVMGIAANAAIFNWGAANLYGSDGITKWAGDVKLYAVINGTDTLVSTYTAINGVVSSKNTTFSNDSLEVGNYYDFYFVIEDGGKTFTSVTKNVGAQATSTATVQFGNMASATQTASSWVVIPEPTGAMLLLLGVAGLALRRKQR